jgi:hypothetical protein
MYKFPTFTHKNLNNLKIQVFIIFSNKIKVECWSVLLYIVWWCLMPLSKTLFQLYRGDQFNLEETIGPGENHQVTDKLYHIMLYTSPWSRFELISVVIGTDSIGVSSKLNWPPRYNWNNVFDSGVKHHQTNKQYKAKQINIQLLLQFNLNNNCTVQTTKSLTNFIT